MIVTLLYTSGKYFWKITKDSMQVPKYLLFVNRYKTDLNNRGGSEFFPICDKRRCLSKNEFGKSFKG